ncbi:LCP family protein [Gordonia sp. HY285]|uniref:LCP family protein n=1 Tax=Gordonia liuliyuniae TaxID=2911517 RepID=A0ABS9INZ9_9ACTN|nr:LCP family protein [Gordonia liuliyuniae]MCF8587274.1 LCP family protein [Gordonia liuliyuniae]MCF8608858.1 LCP family protein [Gordonia liuliyuniae]
MNDQPEPPMMRRPPGGQPNGGPGGQPYRPPLAWSEEPQQRRRYTPQPGQEPLQGRPGYAPRQQPQPIPPQDRHRRPGPAAPPPHRPHGEPGGPPPRRPHDPRRPAGATPPPKRRRRPRRVLRIILVIVLLLLITPVALMFYYDAKLHRVDALTNYAGRVGDTPGTTWLVVGTDSRADLSQEDKDKLATGDSDGARTDTIMLAHIPTSGKPMLISVPRDLYVPIPGQGSHKVNSAFNAGGPQLLVQTVEQFSGVHIDHYIEIGFGGFDKLVDAVGGVEMCLDKPLRDPKAGLRLPKGCQTLDGAQALGLVRTRAFPNADLERVVNQRKFFSALMSKATSPSVLLNPFKLIGFANGAVDAVTVAKGDHLWNLAWLAFRLRNPVTTTVPTDGDQVTDDGDSLVPGETTSKFFEYVSRGVEVPDDLLTASTGSVIGN